MILGRMLTVGQERYSAARFFGGSSKLSRGANLTGATDGKQITFSVFYYTGPSSSTSQTNTFVANQTTGVGDVPGFRITAGGASGASGLPQMQAYGASSYAAWFHGTTTTMSAGGNWYHILMSFDSSNTGKRHIYISDVEQTLLVADYNNVNVDWTTGDFGIGCVPTGSFGNNINGRMLDLWVDDTYLDISSVAVRRKFINAAGKPGILGASGQVPTGSPPLLYMRDFEDFSTGRNRGTGGDFTVTGSVSEEDGPW